MFKEILEIFSVLLAVLTRDFLKLAIEFHAFFLHGRDDVNLGSIPQHRSKHTYLNTNNNNYINNITHIRTYIYIYICETNIKQNIYSNSRKHIIT